MTVMQMIQMKQRQTTLPIEVKKTNTLTINDSDPGLWAKFTRVTWRKFGEFIQSRGQERTSKLEFHEFTSGDKDPSKFLMTLKTIQDWLLAITPTPKDNVMQLNINVYKGLALLCDFPDQIDPKTVYSTITLLHAISLNYAQYIISVLEKVPVGKTLAQLVEENKRLQAQAEEDARLINRLTQRIRQLVHPITELNPAYSGNVQTQTEATFPPKAPVLMDVPPECRSQAIQTVVTDASDVLSPAAIVFGPPPYTAPPAPTIKQPKILRSTHPKRAPPPPPANTKPFTHTNSQSNKQQDPTRGPYAIVVKRKTKLEFVASLLSLPPSVLFAIAKAAHAPTIASPVPQGKPATSNGPQHKVKELPDNEEHNPRKSHEPTVIFVDAAGNVAPQNDSQRTPATAPATPQQPPLLTQTIHAGDDEEFDIDMDLMEDGSVKVKAKKIARAGINDLDPQESAWEISGDDERRWMQCSHDMLGWPLSYVPHNEYPRRKKAKEVIDPEMLNPWKVGTILATGKRVTYNGYHIYHKIRDGTYCVICPDGSGPHLMQLMSVQGFRQYMYDAHPMPIDMCVRYVPRPGLNDFGGEGDCVLRALSAHLGVTVHDVIEKTDDNPKLKAMYMSLFVPPCGLNAVYFMELTKDNKLFQNLGYYDADHDKILRKGKEYMYIEGGHVMYYLGSDPHPRRRATLRINPSASSFSSMLQAGHQRAHYRKRNPRRARRERQQAGYHRRGYQGPSNGAWVVKGTPGSYTYYTKDGQRLSNAAVVAASQMRGKDRFQYLSASLTKLPEPSTIRTRYTLSELQTLSPKVGLSLFHQLMPRDYIPATKFGDEYGVTKTHRTNVEYGGVYEMRGAMVKPQFSSTREGYDGDRSITIIRLPYTEDMHGSAFTGFQRGWGSDEVIDPRVEVFPSLLKKPLRLACVRAKEGKWVIKDSLGGDVGTKNARHVVLKALRMDMKMLMLSIGHKYTLRQITPIYTASKVQFVNACLSLLKSIPVIPYTPVGTFVSVMEPKEHLGFAPPGAGGMYTNLYYWKPRQAPQVEQQQTQLIQGKKEVDLAFKDAYSVLHHIKTKANSRLHQLIKAWQGGERDAGTYVEITKELEHAQYHQILGGPPSYWDYTPQSASQGTTTQPKTNVTLNAQDNTTAHHIVSAEPTPQTQQSTTPQAQEQPQKQPQEAHPKRPKLQPQDTHYTPLADMGFTESEIGEDQGHAYEDKSATAEQNAPENVEPQATEKQTPTFPPPTKTSDNDTPNASTPQTSTSKPVV